MTLRKHQREAKEAAERIRGGQGSTILAHVVPGGGKSWLPMLVAKELPPETKIGWFVPRDNLRHQAALDAKEKFDVVLNDCGNDITPSRGTAGFVTTHQGLTANPDLWRYEFQRYPYLCVVDELHHAWIDRGGDEAELTKALRRLPARYWLSMTGTLERNGPTLIYSIQYEPSENGLRPNGNASADHFIRYTREQALAEGAITPLDFHHHDGPVKWLDGTSNEEIECRLSDADKDDASAGLFTALSTEFATQLFSTAVDHWRVHGHKLLVVCGRQEDARAYAKRMKGEPGGVYLAITENDEASEHIKRFRAANGKSILVTCMMAYEGLDVPAISHICALTHIRSTPWIYQMLARAWRVFPDKPLAYCFCPDDPRMNAVIRRIQTEQERVVRDTPRDGNGKGNGNGGAVDVLPLSGVVEDIRRSALDGSPVTQAQEEFAALVRKSGMDINDPTFRAAWEKLGTQVAIPATAETFGEMKHRMQKDIADLCRRKDHDRGLDFGTTQKRVYDRTRKSITAMTPEELKAAYHVAANI